MQALIRACRRCASIDALATAAFIVLAGPAPALALDTELIKSGLSSPLFLTAPDGDSRLFVVERDGRIQVDSGGMWSTFLDITPQVANDGERGLLGLAFDPNFASNGAFYVDYVGKDLNTHIDRFTVSSPGANVATPSSQAPLLTVAQPPDLSNHKAGWIGFRPGESNNLYIATGDGGAENDPGNNGENTNSLLGKMLRIDVHPANPSVPYAIPAGNPFANGGGAREVWDYGLRNPFRNSFDRTKGNLIIADVGQDTREEVDFESASSKGGSNYGWRLREGKIATPTGGVGGPLPPGAKDPIYDYTHGTGTFQGNTVIGGYVYRGSLLKDEQGHYFFGDFISGQIWSMDTDPITGELLPATLRDRTAELKRLNNFASAVSFGEDGFGNLYIVDLNGSVLEIVPEPSTYAIIIAALALFAWRAVRRSSQGVE